VFSTSILTTRSEIEMGERILNSLTERMIELDELIAREHRKRTDLDG